jgi:NADH-quinone oxidoreductase subunit N
VILAIALSAVALYYYLLILKQALVARPAADAAPVSAPLPARISLLIAATLIVLFGVWPSLLLGLF